MNVAILVGRANAETGDLILASNLLIDHQGGGELNFSTPITQTGGTRTVTVQGGGTVTFTGSSTYTGDTTVSAGTLLINGALGNTDVSVANPGRFGGIGTVGGNIFFDGGSTFVVSNLASPLAVNGTVTFGAGFGIANLFGIDWDAVDLNTPLTVLNTTQTFTTSDIGNFGSGNAIAVGTTGRSAYFESGSLHVIVIPEPSTALLGSIGMLFLLRRRR